MRSVLQKEQWWGVAALVGMAAVVMLTVGTQSQPALERADAEHARWQDSIDNMRRADSLRRAERHARAEFRRDSMYAAWDAQHEARKDSLHRKWALRDSLWYDSIDRLRAHEDSVRGIRRRMKKDTVVCLNSCDTTDLMYIRGVGHYTAVRILAYGESLGGYVDVEQVREIAELSSERWDSIVPHLSVCGDSVRKLRVNHMGIQQLKRHPYVGFSRAQEIYELRRMRGRLNGWEDLRNAKSIDENDRRRLEKYLSFE